MNSKATRVLISFLAALPLFLLGCSGNSNSSSNTPSGNQSGMVSVMLSDDPSTDWATIGVKVLSISLKPQGGGTPVAIFTAPAQVPVINLVQLDQLAEIIGNTSVPAGTYTGATLTLSANPGDVLLTASSDPDPGFAGTPGATVPASQIQIQGTTGTAGSLTVPLNVNFASPLVVTANQNNALDLEFDLSHPAFIVGHVPPSGGGQTMWAVNFNGPFRHHPIRDITALVLRHLYGNVASVASDNTSITVTKVFPVEPPTNPETSIASSQSLTILADATNGTLFYDVDAKTHSTIMNFSSLASLKGKFVRVAARYQVDGSLVAVRIWASSSFNSVWLSPEGHVLHVTSSSLVVENEDGTPITLSVDSGTQFFFRTPANSQSDDKVIGTGAGFLSNLVRGFKVHVSVVDPLASPLVAQTVDIEIARFDGMISSPGAASFVYTRDFATIKDDYTQTMHYISSSTPNGKDPLTGAAIAGFKWWFFAFPTIVDSGSNAVTDFVNATKGSASFGGTVGALPVFGASYATWNDPANPQGWAAPWTVLEPAPLPLAKVATQWVTNGTSTGGSFTIAVTGGSIPVTVNANAVSGSATLVYQVDRTNGIVTVSPQDLTTSAGLSNVAAHLIAATPVKAFGVPQPDGSIKAYVIFYFTGNVMPGS